MAKTFTPPFPQTLNVGIQTFVNADGTTVKTVATGGAEGTKIEAIMISSTDTASRDLNIYLTRAGVNYLLTTVSIPANSGNTNALPAIDAIRSTQIPGLAYDAYGNRYLYLKSGDTLTVGAPVAVTAAKTIAVIASGADF